MLITFDEVIKGKNLCPCQEFPSAKTYSAYVTSMLHLQSFLCALFTKRAHFFALNLLHSHCSARTEHEGLREKINDSKILAG